MRQLLSEYRLFLREFLCTYRTTGAVLPSGRLLGRALARYVGQGNRPQTILEVGPGTGAVTRQILARMGPEDRLDLVELNARFVRRLRELLAADPAFLPAAERVRVLHTPVEDLPRDVRYDVIVAGLPLNNFEVAEVEGIIDLLRSLLSPRGTLSFFEYIAIRRLKAVVSTRKGRDRLRGIDRVLRELLDRAEIRRDWILPNVPPAWVHHVRSEAPAHLPQMV